MSGASPAAPRQPRDLKSSSGKCANAIRATSCRGAHPSHGLPGRASESRTSIRVAGFRAAHPSHGLPGRASESRAIAWGRRAAHLLHLLLERQVLPARRALRRRHKVPKEERLPVKRLHATHAHESITRTTPKSVSALHAQPQRRRGRRTASSPGQMPRPMLPPPHRANRNTRTRSGLLLAPEPAHTLLPCRRVRPRPARRRQTSPPRAGAGAGGWADLGLVELADEQLEAARRAVLAENLHPTKGRGRSSQRQAAKRRGKERRRPSAAPAGVLETARTSATNCNRCP